MPNMKYLSLTIQKLLPRLKTHTHTDRIKISCPQILFQGHIKGEKYNVIRYPLLELTSIKGTIVVYL